MILLFSCSEKEDSKGFHLKKIDVEEIETVEIKKNLHDTLFVQLNKLQYAKFAKIVNNASHAELRKAIPKYWILLKYKNDSIALYKILDTYIGERDVYIHANDANYFRNLYAEGRKEEHKISIK